MNASLFDVVVEALGHRQDYFPGTGGNISFKLEDGVMFIKASGKRISHMKEEDGVVPLLYHEIKEHFHTTTPSSEGEKKSTELILSLVDKKAKGRPSIETGFHTLLPQAVIHSHSAYANMLTCSSSFEKLMETVFLGSDVPYMSIAYAKPGYYLTHLFLERVRKLSSRPKVIFMKNHGIVVSSTTLQEAIQLHEKVNEQIKKYFHFKDDIYPSSNLVEVHEMCSVSDTPFLQEFIRNNINLFKNINDYILFPDLTVFCQDIVVTSDVSTNAKIIVDPATGRIIYKTKSKEAYCIEENLIAFAFLMTYMKEHHLRPVYISQEEADSIRNMEQEKYRKRIINM